ncbi:MAG: chorismate synthase [Armatimonadetes bacterium]|nr:chorismate synthase [Armatimonadota bacterium]MBS1712510.1 chorismate synthase [Armatimonadota bacterium]MBX3109181.1 chorismate synthase [Fimbriimonadaceae bacterium]
MASTFGHLFRISTFGESHGPAVGVVVDGCPPGLAIDRAEIQAELDRRRPGQSKITTQRNEADQVAILSGVESGITTGTPIAMVVQNSDQRSRDYEELRDKYRPSHADFTYDAKYGLRSVGGGGRSSARETIGRVAAGAIAKKLLKERFETEVVAWVDQVQGIKAEVDPADVSIHQVEAHITRCPDPTAAAQMQSLIEQVRKQGDTVGGIVRAVARGVPPGWGEPVFDKLEADLAKAMLSLPASKGFEIGSGFAGTLMTGSEHNDAYRSDDGQSVYTRTNHSGGIQGGISNGMPILFAVAFKPVATILAEQDTVTASFENTTIAGKGRHDPCVLPRAVPMVEAMAALVLADHALRQAALTR